MPILIAIAWIYVVLLAAVAEAAAPGGSVLGAVLTFVGWGVVPLVIVLYIVQWPKRRALARRQAAADAAAARSAADPGQAEHAPADAVAPEREEP